MKPPLFIQSVFGIRGGIGPHPEDVMHMKPHGGPAVRRTTISGPCSAAVATRCTSRRSPRSWVATCASGLEDSLWIGKGQLAKSNAEQVSKIRRILEELGLEVATPDDAREILKLKGKDNVDF